MKKLSQIALVFLILPSVMFAGGKTFTLENNERYTNDLKFISDAPMEKILGTADGISGWFNIDVQNVQATSGKISVQVNTMKTGNSTRDGHMYSAPWLDENQFKTIDFNIKSVKATNVTSNNGRTVIVGVATGDFSLHGVTKSIEAKVNITYLSESAETKKIAVGDLALVQTEFTVALGDFGIKGKAGLVGNKVGETISITATLFASASK